MSASSVSRMRGRPLAVLFLLLGLWVTVRIMLWESPFPISRSLAELGPQLLAASSPGASEPERAGHGAGQADEPSGYVLPPDNVYGIEAPLEPPVWPQEFERPIEPPLGQPLPPPTVRTAAAHQLMWLAAMSQLPMPDVIGERATSAAGPGKALAAKTPDTDRWSLDGWAFWRDGSTNGLNPQGRQPIYGASQLGAVLRYRLAPQNARDPRAYLRVYKALITGGESEVAAGFSARPLAKLPLRAHAEMRATRFTGGTEIRPAVFATSELPVARLPAGFRGEAYLQGGYGGGKQATAFADGQVHLLREVHEFDLGKVSVGGGAWGGAQEGARRIDLGPSMRVDVQLGETPARVSVDWRERVAGNAEPRSGVSVTLSTRF
ncbi:hypothetical protein [Altererythrobacter sp.]|uniref:hypothetical protein n=1 Tax=Altererythrobacter sp. TaxID=1872480 RepID=UPI003D0F77B6